MAELPTTAPTSTIIDAPVVLLQASRIHHERVLSRLFEKHGASAVFVEDCVHGDVGTMCFRSLDASSSVSTLLEALLADVPLCSVLSRAPFVASKSTPSASELASAFLAACSSASAAGRTIKLSAPSSVRRGLIDAALASPYASSLATHDSASIYHVASANRGALFLYHHSAAASKQPPTHDDESPSVVKVQCASEAKGHWHSAPALALDKSGKKLSVCRAYYKLSELLIEEPSLLVELSRSFGSTYDSTEEPGRPYVAVDIGASPGGWTDLLSRHAHVRVVAIDPAELDVPVAARPNVTHMRELLVAVEGSDDEGGGAGGVTSRLRSALQPANVADLVVCDANVPPADAARLIAHLSRCGLIAAGGRIVLTLKAGFRVRASKASETREALRAEAVEALGAGFSEVQTRFLFANTPHEITLTATHRGATAVDVH